MKLINFALLAILITSAAACGKKSSKSKSSVQRSTFFVQGDPESVVAGSTLNPTSFLTSTNVDMIDGFELYSIYTFAERSELMPEESGDIEAGQEASTDNELLQERPTFKLKKSYDGVSYESTDAKIIFSFSKSLGSVLNLEQITYSGVDFPVKVLHYSLKQDQEAFSLLVNVEDSTGKNLMAFTFVKKKAQNLSTASAYYKYIAGPGVKARWNKAETLKVRLCSPPTASLAYQYRYGITLWSSSLSSLLPFEIETVTSYPPFSDLNFHCIYNVSSYITVAPDTGHANPAATLPQIDRFKGEIIDSDILIFNSEIEKLGVTQEEYGKVGWIIGHEMGHFFGLDHQFDDSIKSIMSYDGIDYITIYDRDAMRTLYQ